MGQARMGLAGGTGLVGQGWGEGGQSGGLESDGRNDSGYLMVGWSQSIFLSQSPHEKKTPRAICIFFP